MPGDIKYKDVNGDGMINSDDRVPLSYSDYPRLSYGFGGEFRWKKLRVGVLFNGIGIQLTIVLILILKTMLVIYLSTKKNMEIY